MRRLVQLRTLALYFAIPALNAITPLVVLPSLTAMYGAPGFASIAIGQSLGSSAAVIAELGWGVLGPQKVSRADTETRRALYQSAFATKVSSVALLAPIAVVLSYLIAPDHKLAAASIALAISASAVSPSWFLIGCNRPFLILTTEAIPRLVLSAACALAILMGAPLEVYGIAILCAALVTWVLAAKLTHQRLWPTRADFRNGPSVVRRHLPLTVGRMISVLYTSLPVVIIASVSPSSTATFAAIDRLLRMSLSVLGGVPSRLQSWVGASDGAARVGRSRQSLAINSALGLIAGFGFAVSAPFVAHFVFSGSVQIGFELAALAGAILFAICASRGFGLSLVAEGKPNWIAAANIGAAVIGLLAVFYFGRLWGAQGALIGELAAEATGLAIQAVILFASNDLLSGRGRLRRGREPALHELEDERNQRN